MVSGEEENRSPNPRVVVTPEGQRLTVTSFDLWYFSSVPLEVECVHRIFTQRSW